MKKKKNITIFLAEDEPDLREMYTWMLTQEGFKVITAENGEEVKSKLKESYEEIKLILMDIVMPKMDGFDALKKIKRDSKLKNIPVLMLTSLSDPDDREEALSSGAERYLVKPLLTPRQLVNEIVDVLEMLKK